MVSEVRQGYEFSWLQNINWEKDNHIFILILLEPAEAVGHFALLVVDCT
jgi:hypothetical protein